MSSRGDRPRGVDDHGPGDHGHAAADEGAGNDRHPGATDAATLATSQGVRATWFALAGLLGTATLQLAIVAASGSVALLADTIHNFTDALTAIPLLIAFRLARRPPTRRYTYGYERAEDLAGIVIVAMIFLSAVVAAAEAVLRLVHPRPIDHVGWVLAAGVIGAVGNEVVAEYRIRVGRRIGSAAMVADGLHARTDGLTSLAVVGSALGVMAGFPRADAVVGLGITIVIFWTLIQAARSVLHRVLDGTDEQTITLIEGVAAAVAGVEHVTDARARWTGHQLRSELNIDVDPGISVAAGHDVAIRVREALLRDVPRLAEATVHVDPHEHPSHG
jgi:cation diffusion facilitator family transporter